MQISQISVALATRDGATHLPAFLDSLLMQRQLPRELIASDDASVDETPFILESFATRAPFPVQIQRNPAALGIEKNFAQAITACRGPLIALADQDDIWYPEKLAWLAQAFSSTEVLAAFTDAKVVDAKGMPLGYTMWQRVRFTAKEQKRMAQGEGFPVLLKHTVVTGATMAFRAEFRDVALPIPNGWQHDAWLALMAAARGTIAVNPTPLISYRQHSKNAVGGLKLPIGQEVRRALALDREAWYRSELARWHELTTRLAFDLTSATASQELAEKMAHIEARANLPANRWQRLPVVLREISSGRYGRYARNWGSVAIDLLVK